MTSRPPAAEQALAILRYLARQAGPVPASRIAVDLGLPRSTTYFLLGVLVADAFAVHLPEERRYGLGVTAFEIGSAYSRQAPLARLARPLLARLVDGVHESGHMAVLHGREVLYILEERAPGKPPLVTDVGVRLPAQLTASGLAILADLPAAQVRALFPDRSAFATRTGVGPATLQQLRRLLVEVRRRGHALEDGEVSSGLASTAAAVHDHTGHPIAGVAVTYASGRPQDDVVTAVRRCAEELTRRIGGRPRLPPKPLTP